MANKYFIWKNPECDGTNLDWQEISGSKFFELMKDKTKKRYFKKIDEGEEDGADVLFFETTYAEYKKWHKEHESTRCKKKTQEKYKPRFVSLYDSIQDSEHEITYGDSISDTSINVEDMAVFNIEYSILVTIIKTLSNDEKEVIKILKRMIDSNISERKICEEIGLNREVFRYKRKKVLKKIKKFFPKNEKTLQCNNRGV